MTEVRVDISHCSKLNAIDVSFDYDDVYVTNLKTIAGARFQSATRNKHWHVPLDMGVCRQLRELFGDNLVIGEELIAWAKAQNKLEKKIGKLSAGDSATLTRLPSQLPSLYQAMHLGPKGLMMTAAERRKALQGPASFQCADIAFMANSPAPLNGNQPGLGKTPETIGAVWEAGLEEGDHLVIAPSSAVDGTWEPELEMWHKDAPKEVGIFACTGSRKEREEVLAAWQESTAPVRWVVVNPAMLQYVKDKTRTSKVTFEVKGEKKAAEACYCNRGAMSHEHYVPPYPILHKTHWRTVINDECQKGNIRNHRTITSKSINDLRIDDKRIALSGTPMKKRGVDLFGILHWLRPDVFTSFWKLAGSYFEITNNGFGMKVGPLRRDMEMEFYRTLTPYMLRRTKAECAPWLPPKQYIEVPCTMTPKQEKQYKDMEADGVARISDEDVAVTSILAEFTRLRQFSFGYCKMDKSGKVVPTEDSGKLLALLEKMEEHGMFDEDSREKQVVFSQSREVIELVADALRKRGLKTDIVSGKQNKKGQRRQIKEEFQSGETRVLCIVTTAGGVSLTLDAADVAHMLDDMWAPDETEQAEDRIHRVSRVHQVTIYQYRTRGSIDFYVKGTSDDKRSEHERILDIRRKLIAHT